MMNREPDNEPNAFWEAFRNGDADAYGSLIRLYYNDLFNYGIRFTQDEETVKDCIQDLFLSLWKNHASVQQTSFVKYYLLKSLRRLIARNVHKKSWFRGSDGPEFEARFGTALSAETTRIKDESLRELSQKMHKAISKLSRRQQEVIYLRFYLDAEIADIADIIGIGRQSVYNLLHDALKKLKELPRNDLDITMLIACIEAGLLAASSHLS